MEEMKTYHRYLAVAFYDYKKAYDKVHHDWMLKVYKWTGILDIVKILLGSIMREQDWRSGKMKKSIIDGLIECAVPSKVIAIRPWVFVCLKFQYANYPKNPKDTVWHTQEREM